jgi:hypothetical protein
MKKTLLSLLAALASGMTLAAPPTAVDISPGFSFAEYAGSGPVGEGFVDTPFTVFYIDEKVADGFKSWYLFFDPGTRTQEVLATIHFDRPIAAVLTTKADLDASNAAYGSSSVTYGTSRFIGLEACATRYVFCDMVSWAPGGQDLNLDLSALDPGDHIRVLVAVPEPANHLLFVSGLAGLALVRRRRRG